MNAVRQLDSCNGNGRIAERLKAGHGGTAPFDRAIVLLTGVNYFFRRIASLDLLPAMGHCLTVSHLLPKVTATGGKNGTNTYEDGTTGIGPSGPRAISDLLTRAHETCVLGCP